MARAKESLPPKGWKLGLGEAECRAYCYGGSKSEGKGNEGGERGRETSAFTSLVSRHLIQVLTTLPLGENNSIEGEKREKGRERALREVG